MQVSLLHPNRRQIPRRGFGRIDAAKKNHGITHAVILGMDNWCIGIRLPLPFGERVTSRRISTN